MSIPNPLAKNTKLHFIEVFSFSFSEGLEPSEGRYNIFTKSFDFFKKKYYTCKIRIGKMHGVNTGGRNE